MGEGERHRWCAHQAQCHTMLSYPLNLFICLSVIVHLMESPSIVFGSKLRPRNFRHSYIISPILSLLKMNVSSTSMPTAPQHVSNLHRCTVPLYHNQHIIALTYCTTKHWCCVSWMEKGNYRESWGLVHTGKKERKGGEERGGREETKGERRGR